MIRRSFLVGAAATAAAGGLASLNTRTTQSQGPERKDRQFELNMVTTWPQNFPGLGTSAERFARRVDSASGGSIRIKVYAAGELVPALGAFDAVQRGLADLYHGAEYYWQGRSPAFNFFAAVPFGMNANEMSAWIRFGGGQQLWDELSARFGIKALAAANSGVQMGGWFKKPIESLEDFRGLKIRMPGLGGEVIKRVGAAAITLPGSEIFPALQSGAIDGTEWVGPWNDLAFGFYKVAKHYYYPGFHEPGSVLSVGFNREVWDRFSPAQQEILELAAAAEYELSLAEFDTENARSFQEILAMPDVSVGPFPPDVVQALAETSRQVVAETAEHDGLTRRIHDSFMAFRQSSIDYNRVSELAFAEARLAASKPQES